MVGVSKTLVRCVLASVSIVMLCLSVGCEREVDTIGKNPVTVKGDEAEGEVENYQTQDDTPSTELQIPEGYTDYTNLEYGISFQHLSTWHVKSHDAQRITDPENTLELVNENNEPVVFIYSYINRDNLDISDVIERHVLRTTGGDDRADETIMINGEEVWQSSYLVPGYSGQIGVEKLDQNIYTAFRHGARINIFAISIPVDPDTKEIIESTSSDKKVIYDLILSTVELLNDANNEVFLEI